MWKHLSILKDYDIEIFRKMGLYAYELVVLKCYCCSRATFKATTKYDVHLLI